MDAQLMETRDVCPGTAVQGETHGQTKFATHGRGCGPARIKTANEYSRLGHFACADSDHFCGPVRHVSERTPSREGWNGVCTHHEPASKLARIASSRATTKPMISRRSSTGAAEDEDILSRPVYLFKAGR